MFLIRKNNFINGSDFATSRGFFLNSLYPTKSNAKIKKNQNYVIKNNDQNFKNSTI